MNKVLARVLALVGLASLGEGLFILFRVVPHESPLLGALLAPLGALLLFLAPLPRVERVPRAAIAVAGLAAAAGVLAHAALAGASLAPPKVAIVAFGLALAVGAALADRPRVANALAWSIPLVGGPLLVWGAQAAAKAMTSGPTPMELFIAHGLIAPMAGILGALGYHPVVDGQHVTFDTPRGPMRLLVGVACSGLQAMGLFGGIVLAYLAIERPGARRGLLWGAVGILGVYAVNVVRLVVLAVVGSAWGEDALQATHANAGWMFFVAWAGAFAWLVTRRKPRPA